MNKSEYRFRIQIRICIYLYTYLPTDPIKHQRTHTSFHLLTIIEENEQLRKRVDDVEKEVNSIHEKIFNGEFVTNKKTKSQTPFPLENANCSISPPANSQDQLTQAARANKKPTAFRKITPVGNTIIFGDSNTKGLEKSRMAMGIGSISGATFDSVISYLQSDPTPDESINRIIFHLGSNDINTAPLKH